ncbi:MAG: transporter [Tannerellaceae bacterium]|nr:transporter [Tannerellaceae bacterium]
MLRWIKNWMLPLAIVTGALTYRFLWPLAEVLPYLIFVMLLLAFSRLSPQDIHIRRGHGWLLLIQIGGGAVVYFALLPAESILAEGAMVCVLAPTAATSVVVTALLGGDVAFLACYQILSYLALAVSAPLLFSLTAATSGGAPFVATFLFVCRRVLPTVLLPLLLAWLIRRVAPAVHSRLESVHGLAFYLWAVMLILVTAQTLHVLTESDHPPYGVVAALAGVSIVCCAGQFLLGRFIGHRSGDAIAAGQGLGQKNTILAIWMAQTYLAPAAFIAPATYVLWQTAVNALELYRFRQKG